MKENNGDLTCILFGPELIRRVAQSDWPLFGGTFVVHLNNTVNGWARAKWETSGLRTSVNAEMFFSKGVKCFKSWVILSHVLVGVSSRSSDSWSHRDYEMIAVYNLVGLPVRISFRSGISFCSWREFRAPSRIPNILPRPRDSNIQKSRTDHAGDSGNFSIASVKAIKVRPGPWKD